MNIDKFFINGIIYTMKEENDKIEAIGVKDVIELMRKKAKITAPGKWLSCISKYLSSSQ